MQQFADVAKSYTVCGYMQTRVTRNCLIQFVAFSYMLSLIQTIAAVLLHVLGQ